MELYRKELKLAVIKGLDESRGSSNVPIKLTHDTSDEYINYTEQIHIRYLFDNQVKEEILPTNDNGFYIPGKPLSHDGPIELAVHLINGDIELVTNELSFVVKNAPNGTTQVDPSEFTWQQLVDQYVNAKLDTFANKLDLSKFEEKVNGSIENQNSKITTLEGRMDTFTRLSEGSTTGDAELKDIRVGANGITYNNAGDAVRGQYSQLKEDIGDLDDELFNVIQEIKDYTSNATILHNKFVSLFPSVDNKVLIAIRDDEEKVRDCYAISVSENDRFQVKGFIPHNGNLHLPLIVMSSASLEKNSINVNSLVTAENGNYSYWGNGTGTGIYEFVIPHGVKTLFVNKLDRTSEFLLKKYVDVKKSKIPTKISELLDDTIIPNEIERIKTKINEINDDHLLSKNEIVDARTGYDGTAHDTLGTAIRSQVSKLKEDTVNLKKEIDNLKLIVKKDGQITDMTWSKVQQIVANGSGSDAFEIGTQLIEKWTDTADSKEYDMPWQVNHFEDVMLEDGEVVPGMWLQTHYTLPFGIQFSHQRSFLACPDGLSAGTYNFDFANAWGNNVKPGINYQFTLTNPVERGGRLAGCYGAPDQSPSNWKVYSYGKDGITLNETVNVTVGSGGTNLGTIQHDSRNGNLNSVQEMAYGWNRWKTSALRQYLNSSKQKGKWWTPQDQWDICPDQLASKDGFLCGMPDEMLNCLKKVKVVTYANTVNDEGAEDITYDYVTLPSLSQMFIKPQTSGEGDVHTYWKRRSGRTTPYEWYTNYPNMVEYSIANKTSPQYVRLRSAHQGHACYTWLVYPSGNVDSGNAFHAIPFAPLVCIA